MDVGVIVEEEDLAEELRLGDIFREVNQFTLDASLRHS